MESVRFHPDLNFYVCKTCGTDIADDIVALCEGSAVGSGLRGVRHFLAATNVVIDEKVLRKAGPHTVADVHCAKCMDHIGFKFIEVSTDVERIIRVGDFQLIMEKLEFCDRSNARAARDKELDDLFAFIERVAAEGMKKQKQEQAAEMGEQEQAAAAGEQVEEPAEPTEQVQAAEMGEQEQAATVGKQEEEPAEAVEQEQAGEMGEQEQAAAEEEQLPEDP